MHVKLDLKIILVLLIFFLTDQIEMYLLFMFFAILHELGHLIMGMLLGFKPKGMKLIPMGVSICFHINCENYNINVKNGKIISLKKLLIAMAGPVTNFFIAIFFMVLNIDVLNFTREEIIYSNLLIGIFNLIPIYPLDGGRIIKNIIHINTDLIKAYKYTNIISNIFVIIIGFVFSIEIYYYKNIAIFFAIIFILVLILNENKRYTTYKKIYKIIDNDKNYI